MATVYIEGLKKPFIGSRTNTSFYRLGPPVDDMQRLRVENMERQLANLTGLVQKALQVPGAAPTSAPAAAPRQEYQNYASRPATQGKFYSCRKTNDTCAAEAYR